MRLSFVAALVLGSSVLFGCAVDRSGKRQVTGDAALPDGGHELDAQPPPDGGDGGIPPDGGPPPDGGGGLCGWPYDPAHFDPCGAPDAVVDVTLTDAGEYVYDTDLGRLREPGGTPAPVPNTVQGGVHIWWTGAFTLGPGARLRIVGPQPLLIAADGDVTIGGTIDASSFYDDGTGEVRQGAGANPAACAAMAATAGTTCIQHAGSGGGGGGFGARGGDGGDVTNRGCPDIGYVPIGDVPGGTGGAPLAGIPTTLRGGCAGADGAANDDNDGMTGRGIGGAGGGAVEVSASGSLMVSGTLHAGGAGGSGAYDATGETPRGAKRGGGGGGGSGGMVALEGENIDIQAGGLLVANGGGGGGGTDMATASRGQDGPDAVAFAEGGDAPDAPTASSGAPGGWRESETGATATDTDNDRGTGGGGGGVGFVVIYNHGPTLAISDANFSPLPEQIGSP